MIKRIVQSRFFKNVSISSLSIIIAQVLQLSVFLLLSKYINQDDLGSYSIYLSYLAIVASIGMLQYQLTIVHIEKKNLNSAVFISFVIAVILAVLLFTILIFFSLDDGVLIFLPLHIFMSFMLSITTNLLIRFELFNTLAILRITPIILLLSSVISYHLFADLKLELTHIIIFQILSLGVSVGIFLPYVLKNLKNIFSLDLKNILHVIKEKKEFALITTPGVFINSFAYNIPTIIVGHYFSQSLAAQYFLSMRLFNIISIASKSLYDVYHGKLAFFSRNNLKNESQTFYKNLKKLLLLISVLTLVSFIVFPPLLIPLFFNQQEWQETIIFLQILAPLAATTLYVVPRSIVFLVYEKLKEDFYNHISLFVIVGISWIMAVLWDNIYVGLIIYTFASIIRYLYISMKINKIIKGS